MYIKYNICKNVTVKACYWTIVEREVISNWSFLGLDGSVKYVADIELMFSEINEWNLNIDGAVLGLDIER